MFNIIICVQIVYCHETLYTDCVLEWYTVHSLEYAHLYNADLWLYPFGVHIKEIWQPGTYYFCAGDSFYSRVGGITVISYTIVFVSSL